MAELGKTTAAPCIQINFTTKQALLAPGFRAQIPPGLGLPPSISQAKLGKMLKTTIRRMLQKVLAKVESKGKSGADIWPSSYNINGAANIWY